MESNLICVICGTDYYSASPKQARETTECDNGCGLTLLVIESVPDFPEDIVITKDDGSQEKLGL